MRTVYQKAAQRQRIIKEAKRSKNISATARKHGIRRETIHRWIKQYTGDIESLKDKSRKPKHHPNEHTQQETEKIKRVYGHHREWGMVFLWVILTKEHGYTRSMSGLYKVLKREGLIRKKQKPKRYKPKIYEPILHPGDRIQMDVKYGAERMYKSCRKEIISVYCHRRMYSMELQMDNRGT